MGFAFHLALGPSVVNHSQLLVAKGWHCFVLGSPAVEHSHQRSGAVHSHCLHCSRYHCIGNLAKSLVRWDIRGRHCGCILGCTSVVARTTAVVHVGRCFRLDTLESLVVRRLHDFVTWADVTRQIDASRTR
jgi:hypothetical protein